MSLCDREKLVFQSTQVQCFSHGNKSERVAKRFLRFFFCHLMAFHHSRLSLEIFWKEDSLHKSPQWFTSRRNVTVSSPLEHRKKKTFPNKTRQRFFTANKNDFFFKLIQMLITCSIHNEILIEKFLAPHQSSLNFWLRKKLRKVFENEFNRRRSSEWKWVACGMFSSRFWIIFSLQFSSLTDICTCCRSSRFWSFLGFICGSCWLPGQILWRSARHAISQIWFALTI